jgi:hypothetical protein
MSLLDRARRAINRAPDPAPDARMGYDINDRNDQSPSGWDRAGADAALAEVNRDIDSARRRHRGQVARLGVLEVYGELARDYHARRDPMLYEVPGALAALLGRWAKPGPPPEPDWWEAR